MAHPDIINGSQRFDSTSNGIIMFYSWVDWKLDLQRMSLSIRGTYFCGQKLFTLIWTGDFYVTTIIYNLFSLRCRSVKESHSTCIPLEWKQNQSSGPQPVGHNPFRGWLNDSFTGVI